MNQIYSCIICNNFCDNQQISLTTGKLLHHTCHNDLKDKLAECDDLIARMNSRNIWLEDRIRHTDSIFYKLRRVIGGEVINVVACNREIAENNDNIEKLVKKRDEINKAAELVYDYWPSYPPDWEARRESARARIGFCEWCYAARVMFHVHHKLPIARGGNHKLDNLIVLCEKCHSAAHGGRNFDYSNNPIVPIVRSFEEKVVILRDAIAREHMIHFSYTRRDGRESIRTIIPNKFEHIENSLCIHGYCYLRKEQRTFAIKRMRSLRQVTEPGDCHFK